MNNTSSDCFKSLFTADQMTPVFEKPDWCDISKLSPNDYNDYVEIWNNFRSQQVFCKECNQPLNYFSIDIPYQSVAVCDLFAYELYKNGYIVGYKHSLFYNQSEPTKLVIVPEKLYKLLGKSVFKLNDDDEFSHNYIIKDDISDDSFTSVE